MRNSAVLWCDRVASEGISVLNKQAMADLEERVKALEDGVERAVDRAVEKLRDQAGRAQEDEALNEKVSQAVAKALESHLGDLTEKAKQSRQLGGTTNRDPLEPGPSAKGRYS